MRALHLVKTAVGATWAASQITALREFGVEVGVVLPEHGPNYRLFEAAGAEIFLGETRLGGVRSPRAYLDKVATFRRIVGSFEPDIIHAHFVSSAMFARAALGRRSAIPRVFQAPGPLHLENPLTRRVEIASASAPDFWLAGCRQTRQYYLQAGVDEARVGLAYYVPTVPDERPTTPEEARAILGLNLPPDRKVIGMVAYAYPPKRWLGQRRGIKGHEDLMEAAALLISEGIDLQLVIVGGPWRGGEAYFQRLEARGRALLGDRLTMTNSRNDVAALYAAFDVAVHPSLSENLGGAAESLPLGVPTVATDVGGLPDIVRDGETGWLARPADPTSLAAAIRSVLADPTEARRRAEAGRRFTRALLDQTAIAKGIVDFYRKAEAISTGANRAA